MFDFAILINPFGSALTFPHSSLVVVVGVKFYLFFNWSLQGVSSLGGDRLKLRGQKR